MFYFCFSVACNADRTCCIIDGGMKKVLFEEVRVSIVVLLLLICLIKCSPKLLVGGL